MISTELARALRTAGLRWQPAPGDRFQIDRGEFRGEVFTVSEMTIEVHEHPGGRSFGFNGTTEWALDSVDEVDTLWLPSEAQLRERLGSSFRALERVDVGETDRSDLDPTIIAAPSPETPPRLDFGTDARERATHSAGAPVGDADLLLEAASDALFGDARFDVVTVTDGVPHRYSAKTSEDAYAEALLSLILRSTE